MTSMSKGKIVKPPLQLQLEKINFNNLSQQKNTQLFYILLKLLSEIANNQPQIVNTPIYTSLINHLFNFQQIQSLKQTPLFQNFMYKLWNNQSFNFQLREKTSFYRIVSNWIINFQLKSGNLESVLNQFQLLKGFMQDETQGILERLVMIQEIYDDLKELIDQDFWKQQEIIDQNKVFQGKSNKKLIESEQQQPKTKQKDLSQQQTTEIIYKILSVVESLINPLYYTLPSSKIYKNTIFCAFQFKKVNEFIKKSFYYMLSFKNVPSYLQTDITKLALIYLSSLNDDEGDNLAIINLVKYMMMKTSKAVRFALVIEYVHFYDQLELLGFQNVIEQLQNLLYFRQLIIGKKMLHDSIKESENLLNNVNLSYRKINIKAGLSKKVYFSNECEGNILKMDLFIQENDINLKIFYHNGSDISEIKQQANKSILNINKFVFEVVQRLNKFDGSKSLQEKAYWSEQRSSNKKLQIKLQYRGLYYIQFDNCYSWVLPKNIKYRLQFYAPLQ